MNSFVASFRVTILSILRDKVLHVIISAGTLLFLLIPALSMFSMRQVQELSISLSLSMISLLLLVFSSVVGSFSIWRDIEKRYAISALGLPMSRTSYVLGKLAGIACFIIVCALVLGIISHWVIAISTAQYRSDIPVRWGNVAIAVAAESLKYILLSTFAVLFSSVSTSFFFPFFATIGIYLAGSASQSVFDYVCSAQGGTISPAIRLIVKAMYYVLPNFSAFEYKVQATYALALSAGAVAYMAVYFAIYTGIVTIISIWAFSRRELS